jgi:hypothetical protein
MSMQLAFQLAADGARLAEARANRIHGDWSSKALAAFRQFATQHRDLTTEAVRLEFAGVIPPAPDNRAWGAIAKVAVREGICKPAGVTRARSVHCHGTWVSAYESLIYAGPKK